VKGVGEAAIENILACREADGPFVDLYDFCKRVDLRKVTKRTLEAFIKSGAMDKLGPYRSTLMETLATVVRAAEQHERNIVTNQTDLFADDAETAEAHSLSPSYLEVDRWPMKKRLQYEKEALGFYLSGHPYDQYEEEVQRFISNKVVDLQRQVGSAVTLAGMIVSVRFTKTKRGKPLGFVTLDDRSGRVDIVLFSEVFEESKALLQKDQIIIVEGDVSIDDYTGGFRLSAKKVMGIDQARQAFAKRLLLDMASGEIDQSFIESLMKVLTPFRGGSCPVCVRYKRSDAQVILPLGPDWKVHINDDLLQSLKAAISDEAVKVEY